MGRRSGVAIGAVLVVLGVLLGGAATASGQPSGSGFATLSRADYAGLQMNVATVGAGVRFFLEPKQAHSSVTSLVPVAGDCRPCVAAVNGDFFNPSTREPIGGVIINGIVLRSPNLQQNQLTIAPNGQISAGILQWNGELSAPDGTTMPVAANDPTAASAIVYDRDFGASTPASDAVELTFAQRSAAGLRLDRTLHFQFVGTHQAGQPVPPGLIVVSATGSEGAQLAALRQKFRLGQIARTITMTLTTGPNAWNSLGANHVLLRSGLIVPIDEQDQFVLGAHPRTLFGWNNRGQVTLVTIGSAVPGRGGGVSLPTAARILQGLGIPNAVNLDGGGSSTFVGHGQVLNYPSDGMPRAVANAWVVIARPSPKRLARTARSARPGKRASIAPKRKQTRPAAKVAAKSHHPVSTSTVRAPTRSVAREQPHPNVARIALSARLRPVSSRSLPADSGRGERPVAIAICGCVIALGAALLLLASLRRRIAD